MKQTGHQMKILLLASALLLLVSLPACSDAKTEEEKQAEALATLFENIGMEISPDRDIQNWEIGKPVDGVNDGVSVTIDRVIWTNKVSDPKGFGHTADGMYAVSIATIDNQSNESADPSDQLSSLYIEDDAGRQYKQTWLMALNHDLMWTLFAEKTADIARPQKTIKSYFVIEVPDSSTGIALRSEKLGISIPLDR